MELGVQKVYWGISLVKYERRKSRIGQGKLSECNVNCNIDMSMKGTEEEGGSRIR